MKSERDKLADKIMKHARSGLPCENPFCDELRGIVDNILSFT